MTVRRVARWVDRPQRADRRIPPSRLARFDARTYGARKGIGEGLVTRGCARCGASAPLFQRPRPGCERTYPLLEGDLEPALCGLCVDFPKEK